MAPHAVLPLAILGCGSLFCALFATPVASYDKGRSPRPAWSFLIAGILLISLATACAG